MQRGSYELKPITSSSQNNTEKYNATSVTLLHSNKNEEFKEINLNDGTENEIMIYEKTEQKKIPVYKNPFVWIIGCALLLGFGFAIIFAVAHSSKETFSLEPNVTSLFGNETESMKTIHQNFTNNSTST